MLEAIELVGLPPSHPFGWLMGAYLLDARRSSAPQQVGELYLGASQRYRGELSPVSLYRSIFNGRWCVWSDALYGRQVDLRADERGLLVSASSTHSPLRQTWSVYDAISRTYVAEAAIFSRALPQAAAREEQARALRAEEAERAAAAALEGLMVFNPVARRARVEAEGARAESLLCLEVTGRRLGAAEAVETYALNRRHSPLNGAHVFTNDADDNSHAFRDTEGVWCIGAPTRALARGVGGGAMRCAAPSALPLDQTWQRLVAPGEWRAYPVLRVKELAFAEPPSEVVVRAQRSAEMAKRARSSGVLIAYGLRGPDDVAAYAPIRRLYQPIYAAARDAEARLYQGPGGRWYFGPHAAIAGEWCDGTAARVRTTRAVDEPTDPACRWEQRAGALSAHTEREAWCAHGGIAVVAAQPVAEAEARAAKRWRAAYDDALRPQYYAVERTPWASASRFTNVAPGRGGERIWRGKCGYWFLGADGSAEVKRSAVPSRLPSGLQWVRRSMVQTGAAGAGPCWSSSWTADPTVAVEAASAAQIAVQIAAVERYAGAIVALSVVTAGGVATRFAHDAAQSEAHGDRVYLSEGEGVDVAQRLYRDATSGRWRIAGAFRSTFASPLPLGLQWERRDRAAQSGWSAAPPAWLAVAVVGSAELAAARHREGSFREERARELAVQMRRVGSFVRDGHAKSTVVRVAVANETFAIECGGERRGNTVLWLLSEVGRLYGAEHDGALPEIQSLCVREDRRTLALGAPVFDVVRASETVCAVGLAIEVRVGHAGPDAAAYNIEAFGAQHYTGRWLLRAVARRHRNERRGEDAPVSMTGLRVAGDANEVDLEAHVLDAIFAGDIVVALVRRARGNARAQARGVAREESRAALRGDARSARRPAAAAASKRALRRRGVKPAHPPPDVPKALSPPPPRDIVALAAPEPRAEARRRERRPGALSTGAERRGLPLVGGNADARYARRVRRHERTISTAPLQAQYRAAAVRMV